jgi:probable H4MPT-linked C1 transfer pathway protein
MAVLGFDVGGAHLKAARVEGGRVVAAAEIACPLWQGVERLDDAVAQAIAHVGTAPVSAVTMTGELCDIFSSRSEGVSAIAARLPKLLPGTLRIYAGAGGWLSPEQAPAMAGSVASANWHATAALTARRRADALFVDMGSTTTDIVPVVAGRVASRGVSDAERMQAGELVYTGATRTFLMAVGGRVPFRGAWVPLVAEHFATMADVHRILGTLPQGVDLHATADGREKTPAASMARLARMIGRDTTDAPEPEWRGLAAFFAEAQLRTIHDAALQVLSVATLLEDAPIVAAGAGAFVVEKLAARLSSPCEKWEDLVVADDGLSALVSACAPAVAVALLLEAG